MNPHNISKTPELPVKRKRGRPRKDESIPRNVRQQTQPSLVMAAPPPPGFLSTIHPPPSAMMTNIQSQPPPPATVMNNMNKVDPNMVGQAVTCVIDGIFDNGYLLSARLGSNNTILRGIVFQQGRVVPVTPANDVAPHIEMFTRGEFPIPPSRSSMQVCIPEPACAKQQLPLAMENAPGGSSTSAPQESLRLVEQDDVMQVFEVSKTVQEPQISCDQIAKNEQMVSDNPTAESFPQGDTIIQPLDKANEILNPCPNDEQHAKEGNPDLIITPVDNQPSTQIDGLQQNSQDQTGEDSNNNDVNQDPNQEVAVDLSLNNFPEN